MTISREALFAVLAEAFDEGTLEGSCGGSDSSSPSVREWLEALMDRTFPGKSDPKVIQRQRQAVTVWNKSSRKPQRRK